MIIVSGPPATGKTTLAEELSKVTDFPVISKDQIKELLFDSLGWKDRAWSKKLGKAGYDLLYYLLENFLASKTSLIVESNFQRNLDSSRFNILVEKYHLRIIQIICQTDGQILFERFKKRSESGQRHPGHRDHLNYEEYQETLLKGSSEPLDIPSQIINFDTTDIEQTGYQPLFQKIKLLLNG